MDIFKKALFLVLLPLLPGCAAIALSGAGVGVSYTLSNVAYRSFSFPLDPVHSSTITALKNMDIAIIENNRWQGGRTITAATRELDIKIELKEVTSKTTKI